MGDRNTRQQKQGWISGAIEKLRQAKVIGSKKMLLGEFALQNFSTERTGEEIIKAMQATGRIKIDGDEITPL